MTTATVCMLDFSQRTAICVDGETLAQKCKKCTWIINDCAVHSQVVINDDVKLVACQVADEV